MANLKYKDLKVLRNFVGPKWHPTLTALFLDVFVMLDKMIVTSGYREGDLGCHGTNPLRAFDLRSWIYDNPEGIANRVNQRWIYDPDRPGMKCCMLHNVGKGVHLHFQVHPNTVYKGV